MICNIEVSVESDNLDVEIEVCTQDGCPSVDVEVDPNEIEVEIDVPYKQGIPGQNAVNALPKWEHIDITSLILSDQFIDLLYLIQADSLQVSFNGIIQYEGLTYELSTVSGKTRVTLLGALAIGGDYSLSTSDIIHFNYRYIA